MNTYNNTPSTKGQVYNADLCTQLIPSKANDPDVPNVGKREVNIAPEGFHDEIPENGITIGLGEEISHDVRKIVEENCKDSKNLHICIEKVHQTLSETHLNTHTKRFILLTAGTVALILQWAVTAVITLGAVGGALAIDSYKQSKVHLTYEDVAPIAQLDDIGDASEIAFATGSGDDIRIVATVTVTPTPTPTPDAK